ncbi:MAG: cohesin domain-containing protein [Candidatus Poribacteria bacterium]|nr:cohesin domain-containing protein [Candidatus Poribacteria bacterium]
MNTDILNQKGFVFILVSILMVTFGTQSISYAQEDPPTITASVEEPLTETTLDGSIITLTLTGGRFPNEWAIGGALFISGIDGVTFDPWDDVERVSDTEVTIELEFDGSDFDTDATLTFTMWALTTTLPVTAMQESLVASTESPLTEATLDGSIITLTLSGSRFVDSGWGISRAVSVSGIDEGILRGSVERVNDTEVTVLLVFFGNIDTDATLTFTVEAGAIAEYNGNALTATLPVTAVETTLEASTETPLTEATLDGGIITLSGAVYADWVIVSASGIDGVTIEQWNVARVSDTEVAILLEFDGTDFDTDAVLTFTVEAVAIAGGYNGPPLTAEVPVIPRQQSNATMSISPASVVCPDIGEALTFSLNIKGGENIAGYQATVSFNRTALWPVNITNGDYLPMDTFFMDQNFYREVRLAATTLAGAANGEGTLATLTFEVEDFKASTLTLSEVYLVDTDGKRWEVTTESAEVTIPPEPEKAILGDINRDGVVNIQDLAIVNARFGQRGKNSADINRDGIVNIVDLVLVAGAFGNGAAAPALHPQSLEMIAAADIQRWLSQAQQLELTDATSLRGILFLQQLLAALIPEESALLSNYPNPFNPETWIPYRLSKPANVTLHIYAVNGTLVRTLSLGYQPAGIYQSRSRAAYWDGKNQFSEPVASGLYFYTLTAGDFSATRKMLIWK